MRHSGLINQEAFCLDQSGGTLAWPIRRHSSSSNQKALWLDQSGGTLAWPIRRHSGSTNQGAVRRKDVLSIPLKQVKLWYFWLVSKQMAVRANGSASRVCLHTCSISCCKTDRTFSEHWICQLNRFYWKFLFRYQLLLQRVGISRYTYTIFNLLILSFDFRFEL